MERIVEAALELLRGSVRPLVLLAFAGAIIAAVFVGKLPAETLPSAAGPVIGFYFLERKQRHDAGQG